jgi:hypothetical protein
MYRAHRRTYNKTPKGREAIARYEATRIRVHVAGQFYGYRIPAERKTELKARLAEFRAARVHDQEVPVGGLDPAIPRA